MPRKKRVSRHKLPWRSALSLWMVTSVMGWLTFTAAVQMATHGHRLIAAATAAPGDGELVDGEPVSAPVSGDPRPTH